LAAQNGNSVPATPTFGSGRSHSRSTRPGVTTTDPEHWAKLSQVGMATLRTIGLRMSLGFSSVEVAKQLGIPSSYVQMLREELAIELDDSAPSGDDLRTLARRL
jgi:hypothetical protein